MILWETGIDFHHSAVMKQARFYELLMESIIYRINLGLNLEEPFWGHLVVFKNLQLRYYLDLPVLWSYHSKNRTASNGEKYIFHRQFNGSP